MEKKEYDDMIETSLKGAYDVANAARKKGFDPYTKVDIPYAKDMAERVIGLISAVAPQVVGVGISKRIRELETKYGALDWRVSLIISEEIAKQKYCKFETEKEAIEIGIRVGFAYHTMGTVASPLEGFTELKIRNTKDGKKYFALFYSGPIRSAGGTGASVSVLIADYVRKKMGFDVYDPTEDELSRMVTELTDYHERITNLQYQPSEEEIRFMVKNLPMQIDGDPSEKIEVSNYKDLPRIETNRIRNGPCLVVGECLTQKAPKLWKQVSKWKSEFDLEHWSFLEEFIKIQKKNKTQVEVKTSEKISPDYTFIADLVAGRPILTHPLRNGGFRLRYGRSRTSGYSSTSIHPATMFLLNRYIAIGTQLKTERPGKATVVSPCDTIEGPIVKLDDDSVVRLDTTNMKQLSTKVKEILYIGDLLVSYGDFLNRAHSLVPSGYCEEWWVQEFEKAIVDMFGSLDLDKLSALVEIPLKILELILEDPLTKIPNVEVALQLSKKLKIPFHPFYTYHWNSISMQQLAEFLVFMQTADIKKTGDKVDKIILPLSEQKRALELLGVPHLVATNEYIVIESADASAILNSLGSDLGLLISAIDKFQSPLELINNFSKIKIRDKSGTFIGARMGRPEKAKMRKLTGSPHVLFPVGEQGGRMKSFQAALIKGSITSNFPIYSCSKCSKDSIYAVCNICGKNTQKKFYCNICGLLDKNKCKHDKPYAFKNQSIKILEYFDSALKILKTRTYPDLIKGVKTTSNKDHLPEHLVKGILRAKHEICVNKDGTTRYDMTQMAITHFKPKEIRTSVEKLRELGYLTDINGANLESSDQILQIYPQDVILPSCQEAMDKGADEILLGVVKFIDELLVKLYGQKPYYHVNSLDGLAGLLVLAIAPHTSAAIVGRIIGFSGSQGFLAHPLFHAATRRDCVYPTTKFVCVGQSQQIDSYEIGHYVESLIEKGARTQVIDSYGTLKIEHKQPLCVFGIDPKTKKLKKKKVKYFIKGPAPKNWVKITTATGREQVMTPDHKFIYVDDDGNFKTKKAKSTKIGDRIPLLTNFSIKSKPIHEINLLQLLIETVPLEEQAKIGVVGGHSFFKKLVWKNGRKKIVRLINNVNRNLSRWYSFVPINHLKKLIEAGIITYPELANLQLRTIFSSKKWSMNLKIDKHLMALLGYYAAEGHSRQTKTVSQVSFRILDPDIQKKVISSIKKTFKVSPILEDESKITICHKLVYFFFRYCLKTGSGAYDKKVPNILYNVSDDLVKVYVSAFFDGDGSIILGANRVCFYSVSKSLLDDIALLLSRFCLVGRFQKTKPRLPGKAVLERYQQLGKEPKKHVLYHLSYIGMDFYNLVKILEPIHREKNNRMNKIQMKNPLSRITYYGGKKHTLDTAGDVLYDFIKDITVVTERKNSYCLEIDWENDADKNILWGEQIINARCDGDEASIILLLDALLNSSRDFLPAHRGAKQDACLVLIPELVPSEVDDMAFDLDVVWRYPLEFYEACIEYKKPWEVEIETLGKTINDSWSKKIGFTHGCNNINVGVKCSAYKTLPTMEEKLLGQMDLAERIRAVDQADVAQRVIEKHFLKDIKGQLRKFSMQQFRCVKCNEKFRRPPLIGKCLKCDGRIIFTISEGSVVKYLGPSISLANKYNVPNYLKQTLELTKLRIQSVFGKEKETQLGLGNWFG